MLLRVYRMRCKPGMAPVFEAAANSLALAVGACDGSIDVLVAKVDDTGYLFIEQWRDEAARTAAGNAVDKQVFANLFAVLDGKPETVDARILPLDWEEKV
jgi:quinol monooxygenase YgiN